MMIEQWNDKLKEEAMHVVSFAPGITLRVKTAYHRKDIATLTKPDLAKVLRARTLLASAMQEIERLSKLLKDWGG